MPRNLPRPAAAFALAALIAGLSGCSALDKINPFSSSEPAAKIAELVNFTPTANLQTRWQTGVGSSGEFTFTPAIVGSSVYAAAKDGSISRIDKGSVVWRISAGQMLSGGVGSDGLLVVVGTPKGEVLAFDATDGKERWRTRVSSEVLSAPVLGDGLVIVRSGDSRIFGFEPSDGKRRWVYQRSTPSLSLRSAVGVMIEDKVTLAGFPGGKLVAIANNNGAQMWEISVAMPKGATELERLADVTSNPVISNGTVCAGAFQGRVSCYDADNGTVLWSRELSSSAGVDIDSRYVYAADDKGAVVAYDRRSGASIWRQDKMALRRLTRPLALGKHVAVGDQQGYVHLLRTDDGAFAARMATDGSPIRAVLQSMDDGLVAQTAGGNVISVAIR
jgi:outer membrane protein assembly factor BamB